MISLFCVPELLLQSSLMTSTGLSGTLMYVEGGSKGPADATVVHHTLRTPWVQFHFTLNYITYSPR